MAGNTGRRLIVAHMTPPLPSSANPRLTAACTYASLGWSVLPLHSMVDGRCSCGKPDCKSPGKHPRTPNGVYDATKSGAQFTPWFFKWRDANIGVATGAVSGIIVIDV